MAWIQSDQSLDHHPKLKRATRMLGVSVPEMVGHLHLLWHWCLDYAPDGDLSAFEAWEIADAAMYTGDPDLFVSALADCGNGEPGFLEPAQSDGDGLRVHDWHDYAGRLIERREANAERMRNRRAAHVLNTDAAREQLENKDNQENKENKQRRARARIPDKSGEFAAFWMQYPKKVDKGDAEKAWVKATKDTPAAEIIAGLEKLLPSLIAGDRQYVPYPSSWLNGKRWMDEVETGAKLPDPLASEKRIARCTEYLVNGLEEWKARAMVKDDEWERAVTAAAKMKAEQLKVTMGGTL
jgi:hypothetical protein